MSSDPLVPTPEFLANLLADDTAAFLSSTPGTGDLVHYVQALMFLVGAVEESLKATRHAAIAAVNQAMVG